MPVYFNDAVDDTLLYDRQASFIGGQVSNFRENLLNESQAELIKDLAPEINGVLKTRRGFHRFANLLGSTSSSTNVQTLHFFDSDSRERVIAAVNGSLYEIQSNGTVAAISAVAGSMSPATTPAYMCQIADKMYWSSDSTSSKIFELKYSGGVWVKTVATDAAPLNAKYLVANSGRVFAYDESNNDIYVSTILPNLASTSTLFTLGGTTINPFKVGTGAETVTGMYSWVGTNVVVFCENSVYLVDTNPLTAATATAGNATATFTIRQVSNKSGCVSHRAVAQVGEDLFYLSKDGVRSLKRTMAEEMVASTAGVISYPIQDLIDSINWSAAVQQAAATFWNGNFMLSVPILSSTVNNCILIYNVNTNSWGGYWQGNADYNVKAIDFAVPAFSGYAEKLLTLDKVGNVMELRDYVSPENAVSTDFQDNFDGSNYRDTAWQAVTRGLAFNDQLSPKSGDFVEYEFDRSNAKVDILPILDGDEGDRLVTNLETGSGQIFLGSSGTVTINKTAGYAIGDYTSSGIIVDALPIAVSNGQTLFFANGGRLSLSASAAATATTIYGTLYDAALVDNEEATVGTSSTTLPFTLPDAKVRRFRYSLTQYDPFRELQFKIQQSTGDTTGNKYVALRSIQAGAFMDTMEADQ